MASYPKTYCVRKRTGTEEICIANFAVILDDLGGIKHIRKRSFMD